MPGDPSVWIANISTKTLIMINPIKDIVFTQSFNLWYR